LSRIESDSVTLTTDASGDVTGYTRAMNGRIVAVQYTKDTYADGVDFTITNNTTAQGIWTDTNVNASEIVYPKQLNDDLAGADLTGVYQPVYLADEKVKIVVAQGGNAKSGTFTVYVER
jgi:hypothetical protein